MASLSGLRSGTFDELFVLQNGQLVDVANMSGSAGPTGATGPAGSAGPTGAAGPQGVAGPTGGAGVAGPTGHTGGAGPQGVAGPTGAVGGAGVAGPTGATGPASGGSLTTTEQQWLDDARTNIQVNSSGVQEILMDVDDYIRAKDSQGNSLAVFAPNTTSNHTVTLFGDRAFFKQRTNNLDVLELVSDRTSNFHNHVRLLNAGRLGVGMTQFQTPGSNISGNSLPTPKLEVRDGDIELADAGFGMDLGITWSCNSSGRYNIAQIRGIEMGSFNGALAFSTQAGAYGNLPRIPIERMRIQPNGNVGIGTSGPGFMLQVNGSAYSHSFQSPNKSFLIDHPDPAKPGWKLRHRCIEHDGPGGCIYKHRMDVAAKGTHTLALPSWFTHLCADPMCFVSPFQHMGTGWAQVVGSTLELHTSRGGAWNVLVYADRKDAAAVENFAEHPVEQEPEESV